MILRPFLVAPFLLGASLLAQDWNRFRGPDGQGIAPPVEVTSFAPEEAAWKIVLPGEGHSSPVVWRKSIVVTAVDPEARKRFVLALDVATGKRLWSHEETVRPHRQHRLNSFAASTPAANERGVYVAWTNDASLELVALDHEGSVRWRKEIGPHRAQHGSGTSPIVVEGTVIVANDHEAEGAPSSLVGLDHETGEERWRRSRETVRAAYSTPVTRRVEERTEVIFTSSAHGVTALDPKTGELRWEVRDLFEERCVGSLAYSQEGVAFASAGSGGGGKESVLLQLANEKDSEKAPELLARPRRALPYVPTPIAKGDRLYLWNDGGIVSCLALPTAKVLWSERVGGTFYGSPILLGDRLLALSAAGELVVLRAADTFEILERRDFGETCHATPAAAGGRVFVRTVRTLYAFGEE